ncbi:hypothetical protein ACG3SL_15330 [Sphingomonas sp. CJ20]
MTKTNRNRAILSGTSLLTVALVGAQPVLAQDTTIATSITTGTVWSAAGAPGSNFTITSTGTINTANPSALTITAGVGTVTGTVGTLSNAGLVNNTSAVGNGIRISTSNSDTITVGALDNAATGTISSVATGLLLSNAGRLGVLTNAGRISGFSGISSNGSIGSLSNTGVIAGNKRGIVNFNNGRIGTLNNAGTITVAPGAAGAAGGVANYGGSILTLINTGTIISSSSSGIGNNQAGASIGQITNSGLISGATGGLWNSGTMSQVTNTGRIIGAMAGVFHESGTIGTINNSGTISGGSYGISIGTGAFNSLINSGTVRGAIALYFASGVSVPNITNSGVIAGSINNRSVNVLTISGGTGATFGTLTGNTLTNKGTIISTLANLEFASGNLVLNDNINATGQTVVNSGANLVLNSGINVAGAFNQTAGTLVVNPLGGLIATGVATASSGSIQSNFVSTGNYLAGTYTLLGGSSLNIFGLTVDVGTLANLDRSVNATGTALQLLINNSYVGGTLATGTNAAALTSSDTALYVATTGSIGTFSNTGTLGGARYGVNNLGTIGLLSNAGSINGQTGLWNQGSLGNISNSGTITATYWAIQNSGALGTLTNTGVIAGGENAVQNDSFITLLDNSGTMSGSLNAIAGNIGTIINSGVIRGDINADTGGLIGTIIGGTGGTVGTFTGFNPGTQDTIGLSGNLTFASGALLLDNSISALGIAASALIVSNAGADITLSTIVNVNGNFRQSAGLLNLGTAGKLAVTQAASITGGTITTGANGFSANATYLKGAAGGTLVSGGVGSSYSGVSIVSSGGFTGLAFGSATSGTNLLLSANNIYVGDTQASINNSDSISGTTWALYVANTGAIGTLINSGTLTGLNDGLSSNGSIGSLSNSGLISGGQKGLGNQNTITNLTNTSTGTILGGTAAGLQNDTWMGTLTNAGLISSGSAGFANYGTLGLLSNSGSINGGPQGIYLDGNSNTGTISNSGTITSGQTAVQVSGTLGALVNSGYIGNATNAVNVAGTLTTLVNQAGGTLSGNNVVYISGSLGGLSNSGAIKGRIDNQTANNLTITGGAAGTIGTLTGTSGIGTINNTLSNVVFASGNLLLNDRIIATGRTVSNTGASLSLTSNISITGNYSQSAGTLSLTPGTSSLIVSGAANLSGGTVLANLSSTGNYLASSYTLVSGGASSSLSGATVSAGSITGLASSSSISGNNLLLAIANDYVGGSLSTLANAAALTSAATGLYVATTGSIGTVSNTGTLGGTQFGVNNRGTIGILSNAGRITNANFTALWNQGSIGQIVNTGTITNSSWAIRNSGTIGTVTNSGVITGAGVGIQNNAVVNVVNNSGTLSGQNALAGTFGTVINSGLIRGNINPFGGVVGTILGGTGGAVGTFTGSSGTTQGTIGASGNLTFASGALLLNDTIKAVNIAPSALTVSNSGANIALSTIVSIDGNFSQSAGTLSLGTAGQLVVSQAATFTGGTIAVGGGFSATANYLAGSTAGTLVSGGVGSSYTGVDVNLSGVTGLAGGAFTSGTNLVLGVANNYVGGTLGAIDNSGSIGGVSHAVYVAATGNLGTLGNSGTLSGASNGVYNAGQIGLLTNAGLIEGGGQGLYNSGVINALVNTGTIQAASSMAGTGLQNTGTIGTLTNSGLITIGLYNNDGAIGLLDNSGTLSGGAQALFVTANATLGGIANSGVIRGSIVNNSAQNLTISGGTGTTFGTLTGMGGSGVISNTASDLVFSGGNLWLDDSIDVTGHTVVNSGATLALPGLTSITGNYSQSAGSLLVDAGVGGLSVSGTANLSGGTVVAALSDTGNYLVGATYALVHAGAGSSYAGANVIVGNVTGLGVTGSVATSGSNVDLLLAVTNDYIGGTLGTLANSASRGGDTPVYVASSGNLGLLSNSGTLTGSVAAINALGTIGTIANSGVIQGPNAVVDAGGIGVLANSGTVMGNVLNTSGTALTLTGGNNANGVFTGQAGAQGSIVSNANVVLASGRILLDDSVSLAGHTLVNAGALVQLDRTVNVTGDYSQTGGALGISLNTSMLAVSGAANLSGGAIVVGGFSATDNYLAGSTAGTLVAGGAGSSYAGVTVGSNVGPIEITGATAGTNLVANVTNNYVGGTLAALDNTSNLNAGTAFYVAGTGSIGALSNAATVTGVNGVVTQGAIGALSNSGVFNVGGTAIVNNGSIGQLNNSGSLVAAGTAGIYNGGTITAINNSGALLNSQASAGSGVVGAIVNTGAIGAITNSGTIAGLAALYNAGTLGSIVNSGTIAGNIVNDAAQDLVFVGGSDGAVGVLTGQGGSQGTIVNTQGNVVLASGGILLNDAVILGSGTLVNGGATVQLTSSVNVTGNYAQASGTLALGLSSLLVSGVANITGGRITTDQFDTSANYIAGNGAGTLVSGGLGSSYSGVSITSGITGLAVTTATGTVGSTVNLLLSARNDYIGGALDNLVNSGAITGVTTAAYIAASGSIGTLSNTGVLDGSQYGVSNTGTIGVLDNSGSIGGVVALYNTGAIGTILNSGSIVDSPEVLSAGLNNSGTIGAIVNQGTISGESRGLYNTGAIASVANSGTIAGALALFNGGSIGTFTNSGLLLDSAAPTSAALNNAGTLNVVANSSTITGATYAILNSGTLDQLSNSGLIQAVTAIANQSTGTLGPIANTGVIAGNIENAAAQALTFTGGTESSFGTLTGLTGGRGTITNSGGNVVFASGNLVLNDDVVATGHAVTNTGAVLRLDNSAAVTGDYSQTAGSLVLATGKQLNVSGAASLTGGSVSTTLPGAANYLAGTTAATLVTGGAGSTYTGVSVTTAPVTGLAWSAGASGTNLVVTANNNYIGAGLDSLANTGSLVADYPVYVATTGSLGALNNSGTLSGAVAAIYNAGTLGPIANSGVIAGNVQNVSAQALTFTGGTGSSFGTLTGLNGGRGTITNSGGNVVFASGNLVLNDDVVATGHAVTNTGAVLRLDNSAAVTGDYSQTAGSLVLATGKTLNVSGAASVTGGSVSTTLPGAANYLAGTTAATLITGGAGSTYTGVSVTAAPVTGFAWTAGASGTNLVVTARNNYIGAGLASLSNSGSLVADYPVYVATTGSLGALSNSGTLSGAVAAIYNAGTLGPIANTGVIAGNIENLSTADLRIAGGAGTSFGTLTGYAAGSQGTIRNLSSNVVLTGNLLLNDAVNVGTHSLINNGGTLQVNNAVAVTGNYSQTGGTLLVGVTSKSAYGQLNVSGTASLSGATVKLVALGTGTIAAGDSYAVVKANGGLTYSNLTASIAGLGGSFFSVASGGSTGLVVSVGEDVTPTSFTSTGQVAGGAGVGTGAALDAIADAGGPAGTPVITNILIPLASLTPVEQERGVLQLAPTQLTPQVVAVAVSPAVNAIVQHQEVLAANASGREERGLSAGSQGQRGALWGQLLFNTAKRNNGSAASPYAAHTFGVLAGVDMPATSNLTAGAAISWVNSIANGRGDVSGSRTKLNSFQATGYFSWQPGDPETAGFTIDGQLGFGYNVYSQRRRIDFLGLTAHASFDGQQYLGNLRVSYTVPLGDTASVTPFASVREVHLKNAAYDESGAGTANLQVRSLDADSFGHEIGFQGAAILGGESGRFTPTLKVGWVHNYVNGPIPLTAVLGGVAFTSTSARGARDGATVGAGLTFMQNDRMRIGVQYDGELRSAFQSHSASIKLTANF